MHTVVRIYDDATALFDELATREDEVRSIITSVPGFLQYGLVRTETGGFSITTCEDKDGTDESVRRAAEWIAANLPDATGATPTIIEGDRLFSFMADAVTEAIAEAVAEAEVEAEAEDEAEVAEAATA